ncbi:MAG: hypothetical protein RAO94_06045 [Candidatus Stygibacter australis]|nr:hypothetical protein [Candidatus Stygibacter australis]
MKKIIILLVLCSAVFLVADDQSDELWQKAQAIAEVNWRWVTGEMELRVSGLDDNGSEMMTSLLIFSYEQEDGEIIGYYDGGTRSGNLIPEHDEIVQMFLSQDMSPDSSSIFFNNADWGLEVTRTGVTDKVLKQNCAEFTFSGERPGEDGKPIPMEGKVWLDLETGVPVFMESTMYPSVEMKARSDNKITYQYKKDKLTLKKLETITSMEAMGQKVKMKTVAKFKKYWWFESE